MHLICLGFSFPFLANDGLPKNWGFLCLPGCHDATTRQFRMVASIRYESALCLRRGGLGLGHGRGVLCGSDTSYSVLPTSRGKIDALLRSTPYIINISGGAATSQLGAGGVSVQPPPRRCVANLRGMCLLVSEQGQLINCDVAVPLSR